MWTEILRDKGENDWHHIRCLRGECSNCGIKKLRICPLEVSDDLPIAHVKWKTFGYETVGVNKKGLSVRRLKV